MFSLYVDETAGAMDEVIQPALKRLKVRSSGDQSDSDGKYRTFYEIKVKFAVKYCVGIKLHVVLLGQKWNKRCFKWQK